MGHLKFCLEYAIKSKEILGGVFAAIMVHFGSNHEKQLLEVFGSAYQFRNKYIAHQEQATVSKDRRTLPASSSAKAVSQAIFASVPGVLSPLVGSHAQQLSRFAPEPQLAH